MDGDYTSSNVMSERELDEIAGKTVGDWSRLATFLEFQHPQIELLEGMFPPPSSKRRVVTLLQYWHGVVVQCGENPKELLTAAFLEMNNRLNACFILPIPKVDEIKNSIHQYRAKAETVKKIQAIDFTPSPSHGFYQPHSSYMSMQQFSEQHYQPSMQNMATPGGFNQPVQHQPPLSHNMNVPSHTATNQQQFMATSNQDLHHVLHHSQSDTTVNRGAPNSINVFPGGELTIGGSLSIGSSMQSLNTQQYQHSITQGASSMNVVDGARHMNYGGPESLNVMGKVNTTPGSNISLGTNGPVVKPFGNTEDVNRNYFQSYITEDLHSRTKNLPANFIKDFGSFMPISSIKALGNLSDSICLIVWPGGWGTGFRVGSKYIMTALHVVQGILASGYQNVQGSSLEYAALGVDNVFAVFGYLSNDFQKNNSNTFYFEPNVNFEDEGLDTAVLELKTNLIGPELPPAFIQFSTPKFDKTFYIIGHSNGDVKQLDEVTGIVDVGSEVTKSEITELQKWSKNTHNLEYDKNNTLTSPDRLVFHCKSTKGASGAPGVVLHGGVPIVVTMLIHGYPDWFYEDAVDGSIKPSILPEWCIEQGTNMASVCKSMKKRNPELCREIFNA